MSENEQGKKPKSYGFNKIYIGFIDPVTGEETLTDMPNVGPVFVAKPDGEMVEFKSATFNLETLATFSIKLPYAFFWHSKWQRGATKAISISLVPTGNPRDN